MGIGHCIHDTSATMKTIIALAAACLLVTLAQGQHHNDDHQRHNKMAEDLILRGQRLLQAIREAFEHHRMNGNEHLLHAIDHEATLVEALVKDLQETHARPGNVWSEHHLHVIEEELLYHENRLAEELQVLEDHHNNHRHEGHDLHQLVAHAEQLIKQAEEAIERHRVHNHREQQSLEHEVHQIKQLLNQLREHPEGQDLRRVEEQLARHERSLAQLIERLDHRDHHHNHDDHHHDDHHHDDHHHDN